MTKLEYDSKIYNSTAPFHISLWKIFEAWFAFLTKKFLFLPKSLSPHMYEGQQILEQCAVSICVHLMQPRWPTSKNTGTVGLSFPELL